MNLKTQLATTLLSLRDFVTPRDKQKAQTELNYCRLTIEKYLNGDVRKIEVAENLIEFFTPIVKQRIEKFQSLAA